MEIGESIREGEELMRKMLGNAFMEKRKERAEAFPALNEIIAGKLYGDIWNRPGLDKRTRSLCTIALGMVSPDLRYVIDAQIRGADDGAQTSPRPGRWGEVTTRGSVSGGRRASQDSPDLSTGPPAQPPRPR